MGLESMGLQKTACAPDDRYGRLVILEVVKGLGGKTYCFCRCDCGKAKVIPAANLRRRDRPTISCGCHQRETAVALNTIHGKSGTCEHSIWCGIVDRCTRPGNRSYRNYGGRGITICSRWLTSFEAFLCDMGPRPGPEYTVERRDNQGSYSPGNCCWATRDVQARNSRHCGIVRTENGPVMIPKLAASVGLPSDVLSWRLKKGWSLTRALSTPIRQRKVNRV